MRRFCFFEMGCCFKKRCCNFQKLRCRFGTIYSIPAGKTTKRQCRFQETALQIIKTALQFLKTALQFSRNCAADFKNCAADFRNCAADFSNCDAASTLVACRSPPTSPCNSPPTHQQTPKYAPACNLVPHSSLPTCKRGLTQHDGVPSDGVKERLVTNSK